MNWYSKENPNRTTNIALTILVALVAVLGCCLFLGAGLSVANGELSNVAEVISYKMNTSPNLSTPATAVQPPSANTDLRSTPTSPKLATSCGTWDTSAGVTNWLVPGASARGDVTVNDVIYYDSGVGEGTTIVNLSDKPLKVYAEWGAGCETTTDLASLVNKDLADGCGSTCDVARIVIFNKDGTITQAYYSNPIK